MCEVVIYEKGNIDHLEWEKYLDGVKMRDYFYPLITNQPSIYIQNVKTNVSLLAIDNYLIPFTINDKEYSNSYVCSPYNHYITYAKEEVNMLEKPILGLFLKGIISVIGVVTKLVEINKVIYLNNWLISTNLSVSLSEKQIEKIKNELIKRYPKHLIGYRSMNELLYSEMMDSFGKVKFQMLPSRFVYISSPTVLEGVKKKVRNTLNRDQKLFDNPDVVVIHHEEFTKEDLNRARILYTKLYLEKYSFHNPQFTDDFIQSTHKSHSLHYIGIKINGELEGVFASKIFQRMMANPIVGYNTSLKKEIGLYRMLRLLALQESIKHNRFYHQSAGVGRYKYDRGAIGFPEYTMIYTNHLPWRKRVFWKSLCYLLNTLGIKMVEKKRL